MTRPITLIFSITFILFRNISIAQDDLKILEAKASRKDTKILTIQSLDGGKQKVKIIPDYVNRVLKINCLTDTIKIEDFWGVTPEIDILGGKFIQIQYEVRGGTGYALGNVLILCVRNNKLYEAMHVLRYTQSEIGDDATGDYNIKIKIDKNDKGSYILKVNIHDDFNSKSRPEKNYKYDNLSILNFDLSRNVFYSIKKDRYDTFISTFLKNHKNHKNKIPGNFPEIILGSETYYYFGNRWYTSQEDGELIEFDN